MLPRSPLRLTLAITAGALALSSCATFTNTSEVAEVEGAAVSDEEFASLSRSYFETDLFFQQSSLGQTAEERIDNGSVDADATRGLLTAVILQELLTGFLADQDVDNSAIRTEFETGTLPQTPLAGVDIDPALIDLIIDGDPTVTSQSLGLVDVPDTERLEELYTSDPTSTGVVCVRHILVETEDEADDIIDDLAAGDDFAELATERSQDEASAVNGGAITAPDNECIPLDTVRQGFDPAFAAGIIGGAESAVVGPVDTSFGWHVILTRPWTEVAESVGALMQPGAAGGFLFDGYRATADIDVDARYGRWNRLLEAVEPIG